MVAKVIRPITATLLLALVVLIIVFRPDRAARAAVGLTAHSLCSAVFVEKADPDATFREMIRPMVGPKMVGLIGYQVDRANFSVSVSFGGLIHATAHDTPGYGCRVEYPANLPLSGLPQTSEAASTSSGFDSDALVVGSDPAIRIAINRIFAEEPGQPTKDVKAVVVVKDGQIIAEHYAPGVGVETPLLSYSVAKSLTNALLGVLVHQDRLHVDQPVGALEWSDPGDARRKITIEDLIRMRSGLNAAEAGNGFDPVSQMEFCQSDMAGFAAKHRLKKPPGAEWEYTSANTLILDRLLGQVVGGGAAGMRTFADQELFNPLHMSGVTMEFDGRGVFVGSSYMYAPARAYARFGQLYLDDGVTPEGRRILPEGWVAWSSRSTLGAPYGAGFWTNDGSSSTAAWRVEHGFPKDGFFASGILGQRIYIVPSKHVVVARFGYSRPPDFGIADDIALIKVAVLTLPQNRQRANEK
ncbi:serine hydrolase domain-containing protein [Tunturiibacter psychrotolerans]|uniref:serine hydrolase domain-containing protein n=1 Tax=Tunturiibacter psychrotolerans TaxID=3069686 RepID=UPI003D23703C